MFLSGIYTATLVPRSTCKLDSDHHWAWNKPHHLIWYALYSRCDSVYASLLLTIEKQNSLQQWTRQIHDSTVKAVLSIEVCISIDCIE